MMLAADRCVLENEALRVEVDPARGADITFFGPPAGPNMLAFYDDWSAPIPASLGSGYGSSPLDWLSEYRGGWQELFPNAGDDAVVDGVPLPFHGEVSTARWDVLHAGSAILRLRCAARLPLVLERTMRIKDRATLAIEEQVHNIGNRPTNFIWGHHPAFLVTEQTAVDLRRGSSVLVDDDFSVDAADLRPGSAGRWPTGVGRNGQPIDLSRVSDVFPLERYFFLPNYRTGWAAVRQVDRKLGVAYAWDTTAFRTPGAGSRSVDPTSPGRDARGSWRSNRKPPTQEMAFSRR